MPNLEAKYKKIWEAAKAKAAPGTPDDEIAVDFGKYIEYPKIVRVEIFYATFNPETVMILSAAETKALMEICEFVEKNIDGQKRELSEINQ